MRLYPNLKYRLFFGIRTESDIYYKNQLDQIASELPDFKYWYVLSRASDSWTGKRGYVQNHLSELNYKEIPTTFYLCGNGAMIKDVKHQLIEIDQKKKKNIWAEAFD